VARIELFLAHAIGDFSAFAHLVSILSIISPGNQQTAGGLHY
jgi:hypothetical protein